jgi:bifunctional DNA-binding transcriptional regulator/antitoxin component of YhaV-PrlF toxin-antitoxin module
MGPFMVRLGQGGRITVPAPLVKALGLRLGSEVALETDGGALVLAPGGRPLIATLRAPRRGGTRQRRVPFGPRLNDRGAHERVFTRLLQLQFGDDLQVATQAERMWELLEPWRTERSFKYGSLSQILAPFAMKGRGNLLVATPSGTYALAARGWRFPDRSRFFHVPTANRPALLVDVDRHGLGRWGMVDHPRAVRAALRSNRPRYVEVYAEHHGALPHVEQELLLLALESPSPAVRLAAIASLSTSVSPPRDEKGVVAVEGSREGDRHPDPDRGSVAGAAPADIPVAPDQTAHAPRDAPAPEVP